MSYEVRCHIYSHALIEEYPIQLNQQSEPFSAPPALTIIAREALKYHISHNSWRLGDWEVTKFFNGRHTFIGIPTPNGRIIADHITRVVVGLDHVFARRSVSFELMDALSQCPKLKYAKYVSPGDFASCLVRKSIVPEILSGIKRAVAPMLSKVGERCTVDVEFWMYVSDSDREEATHIELKGRPDASKFAKVMKDLESMDA